jgi:pectate lyase
VGRARFVPAPSGGGSSTYPDASNTGVPAGTSLTLFNGDFTTSSNNQVINQLDIRGSLIVNHTGVTVTKCKISLWSIFGVQCEGGPSMTMSDCTIDGGVNPGTCIVNNNFTLRRCDIKGAENGLDVGSNVDVQDCFFHDLYNGGGDPHADCIQINDGADNITIKHNTMLSYGADGSETTSCIISPQASTGVSNWLIDDNVMAGGAYALYGPQNGTGTSITISNNKFWRLLHPGSAGAFGDWSDCTDENISGNQYGTFTGGYNSTTKTISGTWSGTALP